MLLAQPPIQQPKDGITDPSAGVPVTAELGELPGTRHLRESKVTLIDYLIRESQGRGADVVELERIRLSRVRRRSCVQRCAIYPSPSDGRGDPAGVREPRRSGPPSLSFGLQRELPGSP